MWIDWLVSAKIQIISYAFQIWPEEGVGGVTAGTDDDWGGGGFFSILPRARLSRVSHRRLTAGRLKTVATFLQVEL